ncbi:methyl-accepting chemotaxis protein [Marinobacter salicampi]|uniref:methyl-accepting chemotaxis protein n=1 Tax=Marinobacter salicampi TaxID=435907 RepID=UPI00140B03FF|nr:methyl-accepting chemotaxis protein [Marinobacter salicampi]
MSLINNLSMRGKLLALVIPALVVVSYFALESYARNAQDLSHMHELQKMVALADIGDPLVEALQKERDRSVVFFASRFDPEKATRELIAQHEDTDARLSAYRHRIESLLRDDRLDAEIRDNVVAFDSKMDQLQSLRENTVARQVDAVEATGSYTGLIRELISRIPLIIRRSTDAELTRQVNAYYVLAEAAEKAGLERAAGSSLIRRGSFDVPAAQELATLYGHQQAFFASAQAMLPQDSFMRQSIEDLLAGEANLALQAQRDTLFKSPSGLYGLEADTWFAVASDRIEALNKVRASMLMQISGLAQQALAATRQRLITHAVIALVSISVALVLMLLIIRSINHQVRQLLTGVRQAMENKDLTHPIEVSSKDEIGTISAAINELYRHFGDALLQIDQASVQLARATTQTSATADQNSGHIQFQQQQITQVASATLQMSATSEEISRNTQQVADAANSAMERSQAGERVLKNSLQSIHDLAESVKDVNSVIAELEVRSGSISDVIHVIRQVAEQTNLLALNAAIEAARAGDQGRGFAVVADEVRTLAQQTHKSTTDIEAIIVGFQEMTGNAGRAMKASYALANDTSERASELERTFAETLNDVGSISQMAGHIATASDQQVSVTKDLSRNMEAVNESANMALTGSQEISLVTDEQARLARQLQELAHEFKIGAARQGAE